MGPPQTRAMAAKILALVAALAVSAYASPLIDRSGDVTDFDKVSSMIVNAQNNDMVKATEEAADIPAWETPVWMGRRTNGSLAIGAAVSMDVSSVTGFSSSDSNTAGTGTYGFLANAYLGALSLGSIDGSLSTTVAQQVDGITSYSASATTRRASVTVTYALITTLIDQSTYNAKTSNAAAFQSAISSAATTSLASSSLTGSVSVTGVVSVAPQQVQASSATKITVGIFALFA